MAADASWRHQPPALFWSFADLHPNDARTVCEQVLERRGADWLTPDETRRVLEASGLRQVPTTLVRTADEAAAVAAQLELPVVAKLQSQRLLHKSDLGVVQVGLSSEAAVRTAFAELNALAAAQSIVATADAEGVVLQPMIRDGVETMIGVTADPLFGPLVGFGLGGIHVEGLGDVQFRVAPLSDRDVDELLTSIRGFRLLQGYRGHPPADIEALRDLVLRIARLAEAVPEITELDHNPVIALSPGNGCRIVDARIRVAARGVGPALVRSRPQVEPSTKPGIPAVVG